MKYIITFICLLYLITISAKEYQAANSDELNKLAPKLKAGDTLLLTGKTYKGGIQLKNLMGTKVKPIIIKGKDNPVFSGGTQAMHLVDCHYIQLINFTIKGFPVNGINIDDGATPDTPPVGIVLDKIRVLDTGPKGNFDGIKLSGLYGFTIRNCYISGWGGSAIDMVGCHNGLITNNKIIGKDGFSQSTGIQAKGGTADVKINNCYFIKAGARAINLGGSTGLPYFRPKGANFEAKDIEIHNNIFQGGQAFIAYVTSQNGYVHHNTFIKPDKWVLRVLQETKDKHFIQCKEGRFEWNLIVLDKNTRTIVNVGDGTDINSFTFKSNAWFDSDGKRTPKLPVKETDGIYNIDPLLDKEFKVKNKLLQKYGARASQN